jgi:hypothetical protein
MHQPSRTNPRSVRSLLAGLTIAWACDGSTDPAPSIAGTWQLVGYVDQGIGAVTTGTAQFATDSTFSIEGTVTFPGEPLDSLAVTGTWVQDGDRVTLTTVDGSSTWQVTDLAATVTLTLLGTSPPTRIILARP